MWRPDLLPLPWRNRQSRFVLRLGQARLQLWRLQQPCPTLVSELDAGGLGHGQTAGLQQGLTELIREVPSKAALTVLLDSRWMPLSLLNTGRRPLTPTQLEALGRHRFGSLFGEQARHWQMRWSYMPGDAQAMAFALIPAIEQAVRTACAQHPLSPPGLVSIQPSLTWMLASAWPMLRGAGQRWIACAEHDRTLLALVSRGRVRALHPCAPPAASPAAMLDMLHTQALRAGIVERPEAVIVLSMEPRPDLEAALPAQGFEWIALGRQGLPA